eukprot:PhF_6_TR26124/c0_g3_i9/m.36982
MKCFIDDIFQVVFVWNATHTSFSLNPIMRDSMECMLKLEGILKNPFHTDVTSNVPSIKRDPTLRREFCDLWLRLHDDTSKIWPQTCILCERLELKYSQHPAVSFVRTSSEVEDQRIFSSEFTWSTFTDDVLQQVVSFTTRWIRMITSMTSCINIVCKQSYEDISDMKPFLEGDLNKAVTDVVLNQEVNDARGALKRAFVMGDETEGLHRAKEAHFTLIKRLSHYFECYHPFPDCHLPGKRPEFVKNLKNLLSMTHYRRIKGLTSDDSDAGEGGCGLCELVDGPTPN